MSKINRREATQTIKVRKSTLEKLRDISEFSGFSQLVEVENMVARRHGEIESQKAKKKKESL